MAPWADGCHRAGRVRVTVRVCQAGSVLCRSQPRQAESHGEGLGCPGHHSHKPGTWGQKPWGRPSRCSPAGATGPRPLGPCSCCRPCCWARSQAPHMSRPGVAAGTRKPRAVGGDVMTSACRPISNSARAGVAQGPPAQCTCGPGSSWGVGPGLGTVSGPQSLVPGAPRGPTAGGFVSRGVLALSRPGTPGGLVLPRRGWDTEGGARVS